MRKTNRLLQVLSALGTLAVVLAYNACGAGMPIDVPGMQDSSKTDSASSVDMNDSLAIQQKAMQIISNNCTACHTATAGPSGVFNLLDVNHLTSSGLIVPGQPENSNLLKVVEANRMPPGSPLSATDKEVLRSWIVGGAKPPATPPGTQPGPQPGPGPSPGPNPGPAPAPAPVPVTGSLEQKAVAILQNNCFACHGSVTSGGLTKINEPAHLVATGFVTPGNPAGSKIYVAISNGRMPLGGTKLSAADIAVISDWILAGAKAPAAGTVPPPPPMPPAPNPMPPVPVTGTLEQKAVGILQNACFVCHGTATNGGLTNVNDPANLIATGFVTPGNAAGSKIYDAISKGRMPKGGMLSSGDIQIIADWINAGAKAPMGGTVPPPPALPPLGPTYKSISANIFFPKCVGCHSGTGAKEGVRLDTYTNVMKNIEKGDPGSSEIYEMVSDGEMPPRGNQQLSSAELRALSDWIRAGAPNN